MRTPGIIYLLCPALMALVAYSNTWAATEGETVSSIKDGMLILSRKDSGLLETLVYTKGGYSADLADHVREMEGRKLLTRLRPTQKGPPIMLVLVSNAKDKQDQTMREHAMCKADMVVHQMEGLSLGPQIWSTPGSIFVIENRLWFGEYYFEPAEGSRLCFLLLEGKGALHLGGKGKVTYQDKVLPTLDKPLPSPNLEESSGKVDSDVVRAAIRRIADLLQGQQKVDRLSQVPGGQVLVEVPRTEKIGTWLRLEVRLSSTAETKLEFPTNQVFVKMDDGSKTSVWRFLSFFPQGAANLKEGDSITKVGTMVGDELLSLGYLDSQPGSKATWEVHLKPNVPQDSILYFQIDEGREGRSLHFADLSPVSLLGKNK